MKLARRRDFIIIAAIALCAAFLFFYYGNNSKEGNRAEIYYDAVLVMTVDLTDGKSGSFSIGQAPRVVFMLYGDGGIAFIESDCPDKICVKSGKLSKAGQYAACVPNRIYIKIVSAGEDETDRPDIII